MQFCRALWVYPTQKGPNKFNSFWLSAKYRGAVSLGRRVNFCTTHDCHIIMWNDPATPDAGKLCRECTRISHIAYRWWQCGERRNKRYKSSGHWAAAVTHWYYVCISYGMAARAIKVHATSIHTQQALGICRIDMAKTKSWRKWAKKKKRT